MKSYLAITYGCQMNIHDSEVLAGFLEERGYRSTGDLKEADLVFLNTCAIREKAEEKVYSRLGTLKEFKDRKPGMIIVLGGCLAQQEGTAAKVRRRHPYVDLILGTHNLHRFPELLEQARESRKPVVEVWPERKELVEGLPVARQDKVKALVNITYGCNNFCSYCVVPYVRGRERSRQGDDILAEVEKLAREGYREVTLLGQNVNSYGKDLPGQESFAGLLERLDQVEGLARIRYLTSHPRDFHPGLIDVISRSRKVCEHFHLPVQSGSDRVLGMMNRGYSREHYLDLVDRIRDRVPGASLTTDFIVGFPGEGEEDFAWTLDLVKRARFDSAFTFIYSPRGGTRAYGMTPQVPREVKKERLSRLIEAQDVISREINQALQGQVVEVLAEGVSRPGDPPVLTGRTRTYKIVLFKGKEELVGELGKVRITVPRTWNLYGEVEKNHEA